MTAKRDFARLSSLTLTELKGVLAEAHALKADKSRGRTALLGKAVAIVMEKASTRTRISFEVGVAELGGIPVVVTTQGSQLGRGEPVKDTARVLAGYCQAIVYRTSTTARFDEMCLAKVPVVNALTDDAHPVQLLADLMTVEEVFGLAANFSIGRSCAARSLATAQATRPARGARRRACAGSPSRWPRRKALTRRHTRSPKLENTS